LEDKAIRTQGPSQGRGYSPPNVSYLRDLKGYFIVFLGSSGGDHLEIFQGIYDQQEAGSKSEAYAHGADDQQEAGCESEAFAEADLEMAAKGTFHRSSWHLLKQDI
jgi:hypothetical protein